MAKITDFHCVDKNDQPIPADAFGNNAAFACPNCGQPILAIMLENQRGFNASNPSICRSCDLRGWLSVDAAKERLQLHIVQ